MTACGGTDLHGSGSVITSEVAWSQSQPATPKNEVGATGGGVSEIYPVPDDQLQAGLNPMSVNTGNTGRGVPDVAAPAGTGYKISIAGNPLVGTGGDSATGPLWAALIAIINEILESEGWVSPTQFSTRMASATPMPFTTFSRDRTSISIRPAQIPGSSRFPAMRRDRVGMRAPATAVPTDKISCRLSSPSSNRKRPRSPCPPVVAHGQDVATAGA